MHERGYAGAEQDHRRGRADQRLPLPRPPRGDGPAQVVERPRGGLQPFHGSAKHPLQRQLVPAEAVATEVVAAGPVVPEAVATEAVVTGPVAAEAVAPGAGDSGAGGGGPSGRVPGRAVRAGDRPAGSGPLRGALAGP
ncbi:hypothetical protein LUX05_09305 [Streptomyces somaliensis]|uniref:hypothetical protein n=1 Tax=Streptomyces somaliensis TaxID=78355 RepID=UPI0034E982E5|nr:hypothetical protein [Streptomyces somaliensis]MCP9974331.1 hypothetical protein [Streptomyces somaliensis]